MSEDQPTAEQNGQATTGKKRGRKKTKQADPPEDSKKGVKKRNKAVNQEIQTEEPKSPKPVKNYPSITLEKCLVIPQKIKELNGGNPWHPKEVAEAIGIRGAVQFNNIAASSRDFGLSNGLKISVGFQFINVCFHKIESEIRNKYRQLFFNCY